MARPEEVTAEIVPRPSKVSSGKTRSIALPSSIYGAPLIEKFTAPGTPLNAGFRLKYAMRATSMKSAVARDTWQGKVVDGRFPLQEWLGSSDGSNVFLTELAGGKAALKLVPVSDNAAAQQQLAQWKLCSRLSHPNLLRIFDAGTCSIKDSQFAFVVMEYAEEDLSQVLPVRQLTAKEAREMLTPLISVLSYLHGQNLIHAAIKPSNIMAVENQLKVSSDHVQSVSGTKRLRSRGQYDAPETAAGEISPASDIWSLGATLTAAFGQRIQTADLSPVSEPEIQRYIPDPFRQVARECLRRNPSERCTLPKIKSLLDPSIAVARHIPDAPRKDRSRLLPMVLLAAAVIVAGLLIVRGARHTRSTPAVPAPAPVTQPTPTKTESPSLGSQPGAVAERNVPSVPASARNTVTGKVRVIVRVAVDSSGRVSDATLISPGPSKYFARIALESARQWTFQPPSVNGSPAASAWTLRYLFGRAGTEVIPAPAR